jgi:hypothetical protein
MWLDKYMTTTSDEVDTIKVAIYTDGMGTWQARCLDCEWRSAWFAREATAVRHAKSHRHGRLVDLHLTGEL